MPDDRFIHKRAGHGERPNSLTSDEFRVWIQYQLSADDFGVMRADAVQLQADNDWLRRQSAAKVARWLTAVITSGLIDTFAHQGSRYLFQWDWQTWQKVGYPRQTNHPAPTVEAIQKCDQATQELFLMHPGGNSRKFKKNSENLPETFQEDSAPTRAGAPAKRLTANGQRPTANGQRLTAGEADAPFTSPAEEPSHPFPRWLTEWHAAYPQSRRLDPRQIEQAFVSVFFRHEDDPPVLFSRMMTALDAHKASEEWQRGVIPGMSKWLNEDWWLRELTPPKAPSGRGDRTSGNVDAIKSFLDRRAANDQ